MFALPTAQKKHFDSVWNVLLGDRLRHAQGRDHEHYRERYKEAKLAKMKSMHAYLSNRVTWLGYYDIAEPRRLTTITTTRWKVQVARGGHDESKETTNEEAPIRRPIGARL